LDVLGEHFHLEIGARCRPKSNGSFIPPHDLRKTQLIFYQDLRRSHGDTQAP
jgi:hypothetical protein